jgi:hypothetical protein
MLQLEELWIFRASLKLERMHQFPVHYLQIVAHLPIDWKLDREVRLSWMKQEELRKQRE